jgi:hypothetical protein
MQVEFERYRKKLLQKMKKKINEINDTFSKSDEMKNVLLLPHKENEIKENSLKQENFSLFYIHLCMKNFSSILIQSHQENKERKK